MSEEKSCEKKKYTIDEIEALANEGHKVEMLPNGDVLVDKKTKKEKVKVYKLKDVLKEIAKQPKPEVLPKESKEETGEIRAEVRKWYKGKYKVGIIFDGRYENLLDLTKQEAEEIAKRINGR